MEINGNEYPLWNEFIARKEEFIGKKLVNVTEKYTSETIIEDMFLIPNGTESAYFNIKGKDFDCGLDIHYGGFGDSKGEESIISFSSLSGSFYIKMD